MERKLNELTIKEAISGMKKGEFTSVDLCKDCLDAIKRYDSTVKAYVTVISDDAILRQAKEADKEIKNNPSVFDEKPLLGIPYACKDNFNTLGVRTTASSKVLDNYVPPYESTVTGKIKQAGAILLGKTNMDAFAHGSSTETSDYGCTYNPWDVERVPGGSSGGSAAAVAANMCIFSIGSETAGSIRGPAAWCGMVGLKPTYGRVSRYGVIAMASSTDSPGPITKSVYDAAYVLEIIAGKDIRDATTDAVPINSYASDIEEFVQQHAASANSPTKSALNFKGMKIGRPLSYLNVLEGAKEKEILDHAYSYFEQRGAEIVDLELMDPKYSIAVYTILQRSEVSSNLARFDGIRYGNDRDSFGKEARKRMMLGAYALSTGYYDEYYAKAQKVRTLIVEDFDKAFEKVDMILGPIMPCVAMKVGAAASNPMFGEYIDMLQEPSAIAGLAALSINGGFVNDLPFGIQLIGPRFSERDLLNVAGAYEHENEPTKFPNLAQTLAQKAGEI